MATRAEPHRTSSTSQWIGSAIAIAVTLVIAVIILRKAREVTDHVPVVVASDRPALKAGVEAELRANGKVMHATLETLDLTLGPGQPPDAQLTGGKWEGRFAVTFTPGAVRLARIGARLRGGSMIIMRNNNVVLSDYAGDEERTVLATVPLSLGRGMQQLTYIFNSDGRFDVRLQPLWQPEDAADPQPLPLP